MISRCEGESSAAGKTIAGVENAKGGRVWSRAGGPPMSAEGGHCAHWVATAHLKLLVRRGQQVQVDNPSVAILVLLLDSFDVAGLALAVYFRVVRLCRRKIVVAQDILGPNVAAAHTVAAQVAGLLLHAGLRVVSVLEADGQLRPRVHGAHPLATRADQSVSSLGDGLQGLHLRQLRVPGGPGGRAGGRQSTARGYILRSVWPSGQGGKAGRQTWSHSSATALFAAQGTCWGAGLVATALQMQRQERQMQPCQGLRRRTLVPGLDTLSPTAPCERGPCTSAGTTRPPFRCESPLANPLHPGRQGPPAG